MTGICCCSLIAVPLWAISIYLSFLSSSFLSIPTALSSSFLYSPFSSALCKKCEVAFPDNLLSYRFGRGSLKGRVRSANHPEKMLVQIREENTDRRLCKVIKGTKNGQYFSSIVFPFSLRLQDMKKNEE